MGHSPPQFSAYICCGQITRWVKMPLGRNVGLDPSDIVLDGNPAPLPKRGQSPPNFGPCLLWPNGWMDQDATCTKVGLGSGRTVLHGDAASPLLKGTVPNFRPMSIVAKLSPISATAEHLLCAVIGL